MQDIKTLKTRDRRFERIGIKTHKVMFGESVESIITKHAQTSIKANDIICLSQKVVAICDNNVIHISRVKAGFLARFITKYVTKWPNDIGYERPEKMQVAINQVGYPRMILAIIIGGTTRLFGRRGDFYRVAGNRISEIDGFNPKAMKPFDEYAMLPSPNERAICQKVKDKFGTPCYIIDGNNINVKVVAMSKGFAERGLSKEDLRQLVLDNPMGQDDELTPIYIIREQKHEN